MRQEAGDGGDRRRETEDRRQAAEDRRQETVDMRRETGDRRQESGDRRQEMETGDGNRSRVWKKGKCERVLCMNISEKFCTYNLAAEFIKFLTL